MIIKRPGLRRLIFLIIKYTNNILINLIISTQQINLWLILSFTFMSLLLSWRWHKMMNVIHWFVCIPMLAMWLLIWWVIYLYHLRVLLFCLGILWIQLIELINPFIIFIFHLRSSLTVISFACIRFIILISKTVCSQFLIFLCVLLFHCYYLRLILNLRKRTNNLIWTSRPQWLLTITIITSTLNNLIQILTANLQDKIMNSLSNLKMNIFHLSL